MRKIEILEKSNWYASDIQEFYGISKPYAEKIKNMVANSGFVAPVDQAQKNQSVIADAVIKFMGGKDRLTEIQILNELKKYEREEKQE